MTGQGRGERVEVRQVEMFLRICEHGSINKAAAELRMSQPSLSRWIALLERDLGTQLFVRTRQGIRLTDAGQVLADRARPVLRQFELLRDDVGNKSLRQVNLAIPLSMQRLLTAPFADRVLSRSPELRMRVYEGINNSIRVWMENGLLDTAVIVETERVPENFTSRPLLRENLMLVGDHAAGLSLDAPVPLSKLDDLPIILPGPPNSISAQVAHALARAGYSYNNVFEAEILSLCLELAGRGRGYTVMPYCALEGRLGPDAALTAAPIEGLNVVWKLCINKSRAYAVANRSLVDELTEFIATQVENGAWTFTELL
ncbi:MAG: LysR family transcriptional regulator [Maritimibacter sp.]|uniref:LysR family transcriptional regulator n=1 Tax=Maritimibacter sp. TaxID=2003363 RepID=UPI001D7767C5|nr:LysR family transcriptional regulator [Maritimibacter sp.]MBL6430232.1 LysR family transcriptional regulator [Maritimibacter sp.]